MGDDLLTVEVETLEGLRYVFPKVPRGMIENAAKKGVWDCIESIVFVNLDAACFSIPKRLVSRIMVGSEVLWCNSAA